MRGNALAIMVLFIESLADERCSEECGPNCWHDQAREVMAQLVRGDKLRQLEKVIEEAERKGLL